MRTDTITATGTYTTPSDVISAYVECFGSGGGGCTPSGGTGGGGGGGGGYDALLITLGTSHEITVGAPGVAGTPATDGTATLFQTSGFVSLLNATGGQGGGQGGADTNGGGGGSGQLGTVERIGGGGGLGNGSGGGGGGGECAGPNTAGGVNGDDATGASGAAGGSNSSGGGTGGAGGDISNSGSQGTTPGGAGGGGGDSGSGADGQPGEVRINYPDAISGTPPTTASVGTPVSYTPTDSDTGSWSLDGAPTGATIDSSTGAFSWTPTSGQEGTHAFRIVFTADANGASVFQSVSITIADAPKWLFGFGNCGCCDEDCFLCQDDFDRADTTNDATAIGSCFSTYGSDLDASIVSDALRLSGTDSGIVWNATGGPVMSAILDDWRLKPSAPVSGTDEVKFRLVFGFDDLDNYVCWEFHFTAIPFVFGLFQWDCRMSLIERSAGAETVLKEDFWRDATTNSPFNELPSFSGGTWVWYFDEVTGFAYIDYTDPTGDTNFVGGKYTAHYWFSAPLAGDQWGIGFGDTCTGGKIDIDFAELSENLKCYDIMIYQTGGLLRYQPPPDELKVTLSSFAHASCGSVSSLNGDYVVALADENAPAYRTSAPFTDQGGILYRYTLPSAICGVKYIDFWLSDNLNTIAPYLILASASEVVLVRFSSMATSTGDLGNYDSGTVALSSAQNGFQTGCAAQVTNV